MMLIDIEGYSSLSRRASGAVLQIRTVASMAFWVAGFRINPSVRDFAPSTDFA